ncbi:MAG TPA: DUF5667 domain-containing protein [Candidatus Bathyarchaeia archaeon]|nr:DUF5667 domain-containing protein [Candidatus Bathyarchaeia archaeon]
MIKRAVSIAVVLFLAFSILGVSILKTSAQTGGSWLDSSLIASPSGQLLVEEESQATGTTEIKAVGLKDEIDYSLPYPGILPGQPLYFLKMIRDQIELFLTTEPLKKAEKLLLFADKRISAARVLVEAGKADLALSTATKAEKYLERTVNQAAKARQEGFNIYLFLERLTKATAKHEEVLLGMKERIGDKEEIFNQLLNYSKQGSDQIKQLLED